MIARVVVIDEVLRDYARCARPTLLPDKYRLVSSLSRFMLESASAGPLRLFDRWLVTREVGTRRRSKGVRP